MENPGIDHSTSGMRIKRSPIWDNPHALKQTIINTKEKDGQFIKHDLIEYKRNSGFIYPVTDTSFHSVDIVTHKNFNRDTIANFYGLSDSFMAPLI